MPRWRSNFVFWAASATDTPEVANFLAAAQRQGVAFDCADLARTSKNYIYRGMPEAATAVWVEKCGSGSADAATRLDFAVEDEDRLQGPFDWSYPDHAGLSLTLRKAQGHIVLDYQYDDPIKAVVARKQTAFAPGSYRLTIHSDHPTDSVARSASLRINCYPARNKRSVPLQPLRQGDNDYVVNIPPESCGTQAVSLIVPRGSGKGLWIALDQTIASIF